MNSDAIEKIRAELSPVEDTERADRGSATEAVYERLFLLAHQLGPNAKLPAVRYLRSQFGVSQTTLDAALTRLEGQHILQRRERSGVYVASRLGERSVCLLCSSHFFLQNSASPFWSLLVENIRNFARSREIRLSIAFIEESSPDILDAEDAPSAELEDSSRLPAWLRTEIVDGKVQGVLAINLPRALARWIEQRGVPVVAFAGAARHIIGQASPMLVEIGVAALAQQGCRRIGLWTAHPRPRSIREAESHNPDLVAIFVDVLSRHGLRFHEEDVAMAADMTGASHSLVEKGWDMALRRFGPEGASNLRPDAIVSCDDMLTQGMLMAFPQLGIQLGGNIQVATHANKGSPALLGWEEQLFRVEYDLDECVAALFGTLETLLACASKSDLVRPEHYHVIHPRLILPAAKAQLENN